MFLCQEPPKKEEAIVIQELEAKSPFLLLLLLLLVFEVTLPLLLLLLLFSTLRCKQSQAPASASAIHSLRNGNVICWPFSSPPTFWRQKREAGKRSPFSVPPFLSLVAIHGERGFFGDEMEEKERGVGSLLLF